MLLRRPRSQGNAAGTVSIGLDSERATDPFRLGAFSPYTVVPKAVAAVEGTGAACSLH